MDFFQRCFFGKKLHNKDQIIFKVYAKELFDIIDKKKGKKKNQFAHRKKSMPLTNQGANFRISKLTADRFKKQR